MISIVICSRSIELFNNVAANISETIGVVYEIIRVDNNEGKYGICEAYNWGAEKCKYSVLLFLHEDVFFLSKDWGSNLLRHFKSDLNTGVVGIAGSICKSRMLSSWWLPHINGIEFKRTNYIQNFKFEERKPKYFYYNPKNEKRSKVAVLDGVFMSVKKDVWLEFMFDQKLLKGFHGYDLDFTIRVGNKYENYVVYDILLEHFSEGRNDEKWIIQNFYIHKKNRNLLPISKDDNVTKKSLRLIERFNLEVNFHLFEKMNFKNFMHVGILTYLIFNSRLLIPSSIVIKKLLSKLL